MNTSTHAVPLVADADRPAITRVFEFAIVLRAAQAMPPNEDEYFERPWKWQPEFCAWVAAGKPFIPDPADPPSLGWKRFRNALAAL